MTLALEWIREALHGTKYEGDLFLVGGAVRDGLLGTPSPDADLVTRQDAPVLAHHLYERGIGDHPPVIYERFGTAMLTVAGESVEFVTARRESYENDSRKPSVEPATYEEDAARRDFTLNALYQDLFTGEIRDPLGTGLADLRAGVLRTPLEPGATFSDDPLRMLRAVRFRWRLGFDYAPGLEDAIRAQAGRLRIVSPERVRDEVLKMLDRASAADALADLMRLGLMPWVLPELELMRGVDQGSFHHLDVWEHTLLALRNLWGQGEPPDRETSLAVLLHDVGKPATREIREGKIRFFSHEAVGAEMTRVMLARLKFPNAAIERVARLVKAHMRLGTAPEFTAAAARRLLRDMGEDTGRLLRVVDADASALAPGVRALDLAPIRARLAEVTVAAPKAGYVSPLSGARIMQIMGLAPGPEVGRLKAMLEEAVLEGRLAPGDEAVAQTMLESQDGTDVRSVRTALPSGLTG